MARNVPTPEEILSTLTISVDGPAGSGKSTTARLLARAMGLVHIDTGAMYRAVALAATRAGIGLEDDAALGHLASGIDLVLETGPDGAPLVRLSGEDVSAAIRTPEITVAVSPVSAQPAVRRAMVRQQRRLAAGGGVVLEGRNIGSVVLPSADVKIYLVADVPVRAERRHREMIEKGMQATLDEVEADIRRRDEYDSGREHSPLIRPVGAHVVDTSRLTIDGQVTRIREIAQETARRLVRLHERRDDGQRPSKRQWLYATAVAFINTVTRTLFGLRVINKFNNPLEEPYIFACNHISFVDPPFAGSTLPHDVHFAAKAALFRNPLFGGLIRYFNAVPIRRGLFDRETMDAFVSMLHKGRSVMIFPEGGRILSAELGKAKPGVGYLAVNSGAAVVPMYVSGANRLRECLVRKRRLTVAHGRPIRIPPQLLEEYRSKDEREAYKRFSEMVMVAISALRDDVEGLSG